MRVLVFEPGKPAYVKEIPNELKAMQEIVGGYIETVYFEEKGDAVILCNEDGICRELPPNRAVNGDLILGTFFVVGCSARDGEADFTSLTDEQVEKYSSMFAATVEDLDPNEMLALILDRIIEELNDMRSEL